MRFNLLEANLIVSSCDIALTQGRGSTSNSMLLEVPNVHTLSKTDFEISENHEPPQLDKDTTNSTI